MEKRHDEDPEPDKFKIAIATGAIMQLVEMMGLTCSERASLYSGLAYAERSHLELRHAQSDLERVERIDRRTREVVDQERLRVETEELHMQQGGDA